MRGSLRTHLERDVLAWWSQHGADDDLGGVRTCFTNRCEPLSAEKYTWSQGRWAWTCALIAEEIGAGRLEGDRALWHQRALRTAGFLAEHAFLADGRTAFRLGERGEALADAHGELATSVFADLFAVLGLAGAVRLAGRGTRARQESTPREPARPEPLPPTPPGGSRRLSTLCAVLRNPCATAPPAASRTRCRGDSAISPAR